MCIRDRLINLVNKALIAGRLMKVAVASVWQRNSFIRLIAVSYTHLDVYKRQMYSFSASRALVLFGMTKLTMANIAIRFCYIRFGFGFLIGKTFLRV